MIDEFQNFYAIFNVYGLWKILSKITDISGNFNFAKQIIFKLMKTEYLVFSTVVSGKLTENEPSFQDRNIF